MSIRLRGPSERIPEVSTLDLHGLAPEDKLDVFRRIKFGAAVLERSEFDFFSDPASPNAKASFVRDEELGYERGDSKHGVEFGQLIFNARGLHEQPVFSSVKPLDDPASLLREFEASRYLNTISDRQLAFLPLGVWKNIEGVLQYVTLYEHDVTTFNRVFWANKEESPEALRPEIVHSALISSITGLGYLHGVGIVHRDAEVKNLARDRQGVRFVDLEDIDFLAQEGNVIIEDDLSIKLMRCDIEAFLDSTLQEPDNGSEIRKVLTRKTLPAELVKAYKKGLKKAKKDTGLIMPHTFIQEEAYFKHTIEYALSLSRD